MLLLNRDGEVALVELEGDGLDAAAAGGGAGGVLDPGGPLVALGVGAAIPEFDNFFFCQGLGELGDGVDDINPSWLVVACGLHWPNGRRARCRGRGCDRGPRLARPGTVRRVGILL
jgi:hypothetical protein